MPLNRDAPRDGMQNTYDAMRVVTYAEYDGVTLDDYVDVSEPQRIPVLPWCGDCWDQAAEGGREDREGLPDDCQHCGSTEVFWI